MDLYPVCMKMTLNLDRDLVDRAVQITGLSTKTDAIHHALRELDRKARLTETLRKGSGVPVDALPDIFDPASDPMKLRHGEIEIPSDR